MSREICTLNTALYWNAQNETRIEWEHRVCQAWVEIWDALKPKIDAGSVITLQEMPYGRNGNLFEWILRETRTKGNFANYDLLYREESSGQRLFNLIIAKPGLIKDVPGIAVRSGMANRYVPFRLNVDGEWFNALCVHAKEGSREVAYKLEQLRNQCFSPQLVLGDFNAGANIGRGRKCSRQLETNENQKAYKGMLNRFNYKDACANEKGEELVTFSAGTSIDHILYRGGLNVSGTANIISEAGRLSDHALVSCMLCKGVK